jgi:hypothetical protein
MIPAVGELGVAVAYLEPVSGSLIRFAIIGRISALLRGLSPKAGKFV